MSGVARRRITLNQVHKWAGLFAALWLAILAITGLMELQRNSWNWQWSSGVAMDETITLHDDKYLWRAYQVNPGNPDERVAGGIAGAFLTHDGGKSWSRLPFGAAAIRNLAALETAGEGDAWQVYAATDDGVWRLDRTRQTLLPAGLQGQDINSVSVHRGKAVAAMKMSRMITGQVGEDGAIAGWHPLDLAPLPQGTGAAPLDLGRWLQDIHLGRGLFGPMIDMVIWKITAIGLFVLSLTGFAYWAVMRWCNQARRRPKEARPANATLQKAQKVILWAFRVHAMVIGIVLALPLLLIFLTGLYQDHRGDVQMMFRQVTVPSAITPPAYRGSGWRGQLMNVALASDAQGDFLAVGNRRGMFITRDMGKNWTREDSFQGPAMRLRRIGEALYVPGRMMRRVQVRRDDGWQVLDAPKPVVMVNEMSAGPKGMIWWTRGETIFRTTADGEMRGKMDNAMPKLGYVPWGTVAAELHSGALISKSWKWVNDLFALAGLALVITGFLRWRKRRW